MPQARALVGGDDEGRVFERAASIDDRLPAHRLCGAPRVHVSRHPHENLGAVGGQLPDRFRKQPVVANRAADAADLGVGHGEQWLVVALQIVRARVNFVRGSRKRMAGQGRTRLPKRSSRSSSGSKPKLPDAVRLTTSAKATVVRRSFTRRRKPDTTYCLPDIQSLV